MHSELYEEEKMKAMEALVEKMYELIAEGKGDKAMPAAEMSAESVIDEDKKPLEKGVLDGEKEEADEEEPSLSEMLRDYMAGPKKPPQGKSATIMISSESKKPLFKRK